MSAEAIKEVTAKVLAEQAKFIRAREEIGKVIVGQKGLIDGMFMSLLTDGHLLVEGLPGLAKTLAVSTFSKIIGADFGRIQFTPDLLPADLTGTTIYNHADGKFTIKRGPVFTNILLADEINRAPPKVQSALLEVMQERQVTIAGETMKLSDPFLVLATQNPIEQEGTYLLPEAQTDRFLLKVLVGYPTFEEEKEILRRMAKVGAKPTCQTVLSLEDVRASKNLIDQIHLEASLEDYILKIVFQTREGMPELIQYGASPRATLAFVLAAKAHAFLEGRGYVLPEDIKQVAYPILRHRLRRTFEAEAEGVSPDQLIDRILDSVVVP